MFKVGPGASGHGLLGDSSSWGTVGPQELGGLFQPQQFSEPIYSQQCSPRPHQCAPGRFPKGRGSHAAALCSRKLPSHTQSGSGFGSATEIIWDQYGANTSLPQPCSSPRATFCPV